VTDALVGQTTDRGYTEHEHLYEMGIIHMNGRVYDPLVGRMMSADPFIQAPGSLQSYNRYSYVMNNPLNLTDPSGYRSIFQKLMHLGDRISSIGVSLGSPKLYHASVNFLSGSGGYTLKSAALSYVSTYCVWASVCNGALQSALAKGYGASDRDAFKAGAIGFVSSELNDMAGGVGAKYGQYGTEHYLAHAAAGCITTVAGGGKCGQGVVTGVIGLGVTEATGGDNWNKVTRGIAVTVSGGVSSVILGGSFENGARTAAYGFLFNCMQHDCAEFTKVDPMGNPLGDNPLASEAQLMVAGGAAALAVGSGAILATTSAMQFMSTVELKAVIAANGGNQLLNASGLFGSGVAGARAALNNIQVPDGVNRTLLLAYREIATRNISMEVQQIRIQIIDKMLPLIKK
jgi:RHS repeat-associated protein